MLNKYVIPHLKLGGTSFLLHAGYVPAMRFAAERCEDVALLLLETGAHGDFLPTPEEIREIGRIADGEGTGLHVHLPTDADFDTPEGMRAMVDKVRLAVDRAAPLRPHTFVLHVDFPSLHGMLPQGGPEAVREPHAGSGAQTATDRPEEGDPDDYPAPAFRNPATTDGNGTNAPDVPNAPYGANGSAIPGDPFIPDVPNGPCRSNGSNRSGGSVGPARPGGSDGSDGSVCSVGSARSVGSGCSGGSDLRKGPAGAAPDAPNLPGVPNGPNAPSVPGIPGTLGDPSVPGAFRLSDERRLLTAEALRAIASRLPSPAQLAVENLETFPPEFWDGWLDGTPYSRCLDIGHIWKDGGDPAPVLAAWLPRVRVIHLHGLEPRGSGVSAPSAPAAANAARGLPPSRLPDLLRRFGPRPRDHKSLRLMPPDRLDAVTHPLWKAGFSGVLTLEVFTFDDFTASHAALLRSWERFEKNSLKACSK